jgi:hypothetical protein
VDGRRLKKRCQGKLGEAVTRVLQTKEGLPMSKDIIKTASNKEYNKDLQYMVAWHAINDNVPCQRKANVMNFQLIIPYLDEMRNCNPLSLIGCTRGSGCDIIDLHFFPSIANDVLKTVRPVISLDAVHLRSEYKGMLYIASILLGGDDIYPIGFMIANGNEDRKAWTWTVERSVPNHMQTWLSNCPQWRKNVNMHPRSQFVFTSD